MNDRVFHCRHPGVTPHLVDPCDGDAYREAEDEFYRRYRYALSSARILGQTKNYSPAPQAYNPITRILNVEKVWAFTIVIIEDDNREEIARGYSFCGPDDQFSRKTGRRIALGRAQFMKSALQGGAQFPTTVTS